MDMTRKMVPVDPAWRIHPNAVVFQLRGYTGLWVYGFMEWLKQ